MSDDLVAATEVIRPYPPSWLDRLTAWVEHLPAPASAVYAFAGLFAVAAFILNDALIGHGLLGGIHPFHLVLAVELIYAIALVHVLDKEAGRALEGRRPLLNCDATGYAPLHARLTTIPARTTLWFSVVGALAGLSAIMIERVATPRAFATLLVPGFPRLFLEVWLVLTWVVFGGVFYHTYHQLRQISRIYTNDTRIDLDQYRPLFNFSRVSALTAIGLLVLPYAWYATVPGLFEEPINIAFGALFALFAVIAFVAPLVGVHHLLVDARENALAENARALQVARVDLYRRSIARELANASELHDMLAALRGEREALERIHTWPWQSETLRSVVVALILPLVLWFLQWLFSRLLAP
ncbi:MAG: hypothetical protein IT335_16095 [Thermomicrobiales bacterium]|nr:hypothetical protein [Thermomicrobiales bacterium]